MSSPGTSNSAGVYEIAGVQSDGVGVSGYGGGAGPGGVFHHGPRGKVGLRVVGDLEVTGDMPRTVHVSKCEVAPAECRCIVQVPPPPAASLGGLAVGAGFTSGVLFALSAVLAAWKLASRK